MGKPSDPLSAESAQAAGNGVAVAPNTRSLWNPVVSRNSSRGGDSPASVAMATSAGTVSGSSHRATWYMVLCKSFGGIVHVCLMNDE